MHPRSRGANGAWVLSVCYNLQFESEAAEGHSSSIVDLFDSLRSPINFLEDLEWSDEYQEARFFTSLAKVCTAYTDPYSNLTTSK